MNGMWVNPAGPAGGRNVVCLSVRPSVSLAALRGFGSEHEPGIPWAPPSHRPPLFPGVLPMPGGQIRLRTIVSLMRRPMTSRPLSLSLEAAWTRCQSPPAENRLLPPLPSPGRPLCLAAPA